MASRYDKMMASSSQIGERAAAVDHATQQLARAANGNSEQVIPAPTAYRLLGELKSSAWNLAEVTAYLPTGLRDSLTEPGVEVYDRHFVTGEVRDPGTQVELAAGHLTQATAALQQFAEHLEAAQTALNSQGFTEPNPPAVSGQRRPLRTHHRPTSPPRAAIPSARVDRGPSI